VSPVPLPGLAGPHVADGDGCQLGATNIRRRVLDEAVKHAHARLAVDGFEPLPDGLTPDSLRRTFASLLFAIGETPPHVMAQMGHATPNLTFAIYARQMDRRDGEPERLKALVEGGEWAAMGSSGTEGAPAEAAGAAQAQ
jgi:integrase